MYYNISSSSSVVEIVSLLTSYNINDSVYRKDLFIHYDHVFKEWVDSLNHLRAGRALFTFLLCTVGETWLTGVKAAHKMDDDIKLPLAVRITTFRVRVETFICLSPIFYVSFLLHALQTWWTKHFKNNNENTNIYEMDSGNARTMSLRLIESLLFFNVLLFFWFL